MEIENICKRLRSARVAKGLSGESIGRVVGISENSYRDIENGKTRLFHPKLYEITKELDISMEYLLFGRDGCHEITAKFSESIKEQEKIIEELKMELEISRTLLNTEKKILQEKEHTLISILGVIEERRGNY